MLYHLRQHYAEKRLRIGISQHGCGFALSLRHGGRIAEIGTGEYMFGKSTSKELEKFLTGGKA